MSKKVAIYGLFTVLLLSLITPFLVSKELLFPFVTTKAFYLRIIVELGLPFYIYLLFADKQLRPSIKHPLHISVLAFLILNLVSAFWGVNVERSLWGNFERMGGVYLMAHLTTLYFYAVMLYQSSAVKFEWLFKVFVWVSGLLAVYGLLVALGMKPFVPDPSLPRISITFGNPIYVGSYMILPMFLSAFFALQSEKGFGRALYWALTVLQFLAIFQSGTRGALVALVAGLFVFGLLYLALSKNRKQKIWGLSLAGFALLFVTGIYFFNNNLPSGFSMKRITNLADANAQSRLLQWKVAAKGFYDRPVFGTGTENYYVVANLYHNPEIYKYDKSWFDKPHNYWLEILVTNGMAGFAAYAAMAGFAAYGLWLAFRNEIIGLTESLLLFAGLLVYQLQNLFVFDNIASSLAFYLFLGFCAFLMEESSRKAKPALTKTPGYDKYFLNTGFALASVIAVIIIFYTNIQPIKAAKSVNYGFAYAGVDFSETLRHFDNSFAIPFNIDPGETSVKFADSVLANLRSEKPDPKATESIGLSIERLEAAVKSQPNYPIYWYKLANQYFVKAYFDKTGFASEGEEALEKAVELAPNRMEAKLLMAQLRLGQNRVADSKAILEEVMKTYPTASEPKWMFLSALRTEGKVEEALAQLEKWRIDKEFLPRGREDIFWVVEYYIQQNQIDLAVKELEGLDDIGLLDISGKWALAEGYAQIGESDKAFELAKAILRADPKQQERAEKFVNSLRSTN